MATNQINKSTKELENRLQKKELFAYHLYQTYYQTNPNSLRTKELEDTWAAAHKVLCDNNIPILNS